MRGSRLCFERGVLGVHACACLLCPARIVDCIRGPRLGLDWDSYRHIHATLWLLDVLLAGEVTC